MFWSSLLWVFGIPFVLPPIADVEPVQSASFSAKGTVSLAVASQIGFISSAEFYSMGNVDDQLIEEGSKLLVKEQAKLLFLCILAVSLSLFVIHYTGNPFYAFTAYPLMVFLNWDFLNRMTYCQGVPPNELLIEAIRKRNLRYISIEPTGMF